MIKHVEQCTCLLGHLLLQENICRACTPFSEPRTHTGTSREHNSIHSASRYGNIFLSPPFLPWIYCLNKLGVVNTPVVAVLSQISQSSLCFSNLWLPPEEPKERRAVPVLQHMDISQKDLLPVRNLCKDNNSHNAIFVVAVLLLGSLQHRAWKEKHRDTQNKNVKPKTGTRCSRWRKCTIIF